MILLQLMQPNNDSLLLFHREMNEFYEEGKSNDQESILSKPFIWKC